MSKQSAMLVFDTLNDACTLALKIFNAFLVLPFAFEMESPDESVHNCVDCIAKKAGFI